MDSPPKFEPSIFDLHRKKTVSSLKDLGVKGAVVVYGLPPPSRPNCDSEPILRQESCFFWLTGVNAPDCVIFIDIDTGHAVLFYPNIPEEDEVWCGHLPTLSELK
jgi:Xaa-Pro dipeptidase